MPLPRDRRDGRGAVRGGGACDPGVAEGDPGSAGSGDVAAAEFDVDLKTLTYNALGHVKSVTSGSVTQSQVFDTSGNLLLTSDPTNGTTAYLGDTELTVKAGVTTAVRTYSAGTSYATRTTTTGTSVLTWLATDPHNTATLSMTATSGAVTIRHLDPFGVSRDTSSVSWPNTHGFLDAPTNPLAGTTRLGARDYQPALGRFLTLDPILNAADPQSLSGYAYANNSPISSSDPSGALKNNGPDGSYWNPVTGVNTSTGNGGGGSGSGNGLASAPGIPGTTPDQVLQQQAAEQAADEAAAEKAAAQSLYLQQFANQFHSDSFLGGVGDFFGGAIDFSGGLIDLSFGASIPFTFGSMFHPGPFTSSQYNKLVGANPSSGAYKGGWWTTAAITTVFGGGEGVGLKAGVGATRQAYVNGARAISEAGLARVAAGESPETVARWAVESRNALKVEARGNMPTLFNRWAKWRNMRRYGNPIGPSYEDFISRPGATPLGIIQRVGNTSPWINRLLGVK